MDCIMNIEWWKAAAVRCIKTACQTAVALVGTGAFIQEVDWLMVASASGMSAILSLLTSMAGLPEVCDEHVGKHARIDYIDNEDEM